MSICQVLTSLYIRRAVLYRIKLFSNLPFTIKWLNNVVKVLKRALKGYLLFNIVSSMQLLFILPVIIFLLLIRRINFNWKFLNTELMMISCVCHGYFILHSTSCESVYCCILMKQDVCTVHSCNNYVFMFIFVLSIIIFVSVLWYILYPWLSPLQQCF